CIDVEETHNFVTAGGVVHNCRPPGNRDPMPDEIEACETFLFRQVELIRPRVVATLGNFATKLLSGKPLGITRVHGPEQATTFVRGACRALGITAPVTSPTYTIGHRYDGVSHLDLYRFERLTEADWGALEPYLEDAICFVEWPEAAAGWLPPPRLAVRLQHLDPVRRLVVLESGEAGLLESIFEVGDSRL